jgi:hypothetical protein
MRIEDRTEMSPVVIGIIKPATVAEKGSWNSISARDSSRVSFFMIAAVSKKKEM